MKYNFSFLQVINWLLICKENINKLAEQADKIPKKQLAAELEVQRAKLLIVKDVLDRKTKLHGINAEFLKKLEDLKKSVS